MTDFAACRRCGRAMAFDPTEGLRWCRDCKKELDDIDAPETKISLSRIILRAIRDRAAGGHVHIVGESVQAAIGRVWIDKRPSRFLVDEVVVDAVGRPR